MNIKKSNNKLTNRDLSIMNILWNSSPLTASEIAKQDSELTINSVQAVLRKLLKNKLVKVADIVYSGTVLCRSYKPIISAEEFAMTNFANDFKVLSKDIPSTSLVAAFLDLEKDPEKTRSEINSLEALLSEYKKKLSE